MFGIKGKNRKNNPLRRVIVRGTPNDKDGYKNPFVEVVLIPAGGSFEVDYGQDTSYNADGSIHKAYYWQAGYNIEREYIYANDL